MLIARVVGELPESIHSDPTRLRQVLIHFLDFLHVAKRIGDRGAIDDGLVCGSRGRRLRHRLWLGKRASSALLAGAQTGARREVSAGALPADREPAIVPSVLLGPDRRCPARDAVRLTRGDRVGAIGGHVVIDVDDEAAGFGRDAPTQVGIELRVPGDELLNHLVAFGAIDDFQLHATRANVILRPAERAVLADHNPWDAVQESRAAAHVAGRERRVEGRAGVVARGEAPRVLEAVHLGVQDRAAALDAAIVAAADDPPVDHEHRADRDAALVATLHRFAHGGIEEGRGVFGNIKKYLMYLLSSNIGEIGLMAGSALLGLPLPLTAVQILYVNLATDGLPALALAVDPPADDLMRRPPRDARTGIFTPGVVRLMSLGGLWSACMNLAIFAGARWLGYSDEAAMTMTFVSLVLMEFFKAYGFRSDHQHVLHRPLANRWLNLAIAWEMLLLVLILYVPVLQQAFGTSGLTLAEWAIILFCAHTILPVLEFGKWLERRGTFGRGDEFS